MPARFPPSPEMKPDPSTGKVDAVTSPLLDALSSTRYTSQNTNEWAKNVPAFSGSPSNLINLGESPPTLPSSPPILPSSYEDKLTSNGWKVREPRGYGPGFTHSASPPSRRPLSYHMDGNYPPPESTYHARRSSMYSPSHYSRIAPSNPPLPHQIQSHFYGAPHLDLMPPAPGLIPGDNSLYCGFDSLPLPGKDSLKSVDNVVVAGYEGGLDIYAANKRGLDRRARIDGLRGGVYNAKIILEAAREPLIVVVVHGPVRPPNDISNEDYPASPPPDGMYTTRAESVRGSPRVRTPSIHGNDMVECYQTTVEVYSLSNKQHIATLLSLPEVPLTTPVSNPNFRAPPPVGSLTIRADTNSIVISSGTSGETWLFHEENCNGTPSSRKINCIGKVWTTVQHGHAVDPTGLTGLVDGDWHPTETSTARQQYKTPILSLNGRWLAYCPSIPSSQISLQAEVPGMSSTLKVPGFKAHAPPQLPPVNCGVETPGGESMIKQIGQVVTQEFVKGAAYLGKQGVQAWNNYWNKPSSPPNGGMQFQAPLNMAHQFPPTHGTPSQAPTNSRDPGLISIIDLDYLNSFSGSSIHPFATFKVPHGCSFLSFAPSGLALFTASNKGDTQFVWDLMRLQYAKSSFLKGGPQILGVSGTHVRQIASFSRMTVARIVDVVWTAPHGERAAMVTERGTVHILDLPASAFTWPPPRRRLPSSRPESEPAGTALAAAGTAAGVASSAVTSLWTAARPLVGRTRRSSTGISSMSAASVTSQAGHGTQALAAGISRSVGAATGRMNELRKSGTPKLRLPHSAVTPSRACIRLTNGKRSDLVLVVGGGVVGFYTVKSRRADRPADKQKASRGAKYVEFRLPSLPDVKIVSEVARDQSHAHDLELTERDLEGPHSRIGAQASRPRGTESSIPQAEIESNAPYQPFHTDRRVGLYVYSHEEDEAHISSPSVSALLSPQNAAESVKPAAGVAACWAFGGVIKCIKLDVGPPQNTDDSFYVPSDHRALPSSAIERIMRVTENNEDSEQIVVTTRIRKSARSGSDLAGADEEGFFEDDCEVLDFASQRV
jgi:hypothetical protein